ncbi:MAG TPA: hypothetical protein VGK92_04580 [Gaiellales bacterium]|jgi:hypothetical protein
MRRIAIVLATVIVLAASVAQAAPPAPPAPGTASAVVQRMFDGLDAYRADDVCAQFTPELQAALVIQQLPCSGYVAYLLAGPHENGPRFGELRAVQWYPEIHSGAFTGVPLLFKVGDSDPGGDDGPILYTMVWLEPGGDSFLIVKPGTVLSAVAFSGSVRESDDVPATADTIDLPVVMPAPAFACRGAARVVQDRSGDELAKQGPTTAPQTVTAPWLDVQRVRLQLRGANPCIGITLAAPLHRATRIIVRASYFLAGSRSTSSETTAYFGVDGAGSPIYYGAGNSTFRTARWLGQSGSTIMLRLRPRKLLQRMRFQVCVESMQGVEPLLPQPVVGADTAQERHLPQGSDPCEG